MVKIKEWDTLKWRRELEEKSTLIIYRKFKQDIEEENWIDNTVETKLMLRARTNTLSLNWRNRYQGKNEKCPYNDCDIETLEHFLTECKGYENIRNQFHFTANYEERDNVIAEILLFTKQKNSDIQQKKEYINNIWKARFRQIQETPD